MDALSSRSLTIARPLAPLGLARWSRSILSSAKTREWNSPRYRLLTYVFLSPSVDDKPLAPCPIGERAGQTASFPIDPGAAATLGSGNDRLPSLDLQRPC